MIKFLLIVDTAVDYETDVYAAFDLMRGQYEQGASVSCEKEIIQQDFSTVDWTNSPQYRPSYAWIAANTKNKPPAFFCVFVIDNAHYPADQDHANDGWHLQSWNGFQVLIVKGVRGQADRMSKTFLEESMHAWNDVFSGVEQLFNVANYDEDVVHAYYNTSLPDHSPFAGHFTSTQWGRWYYVNALKVLQSLLLKKFSSMLPTPIIKQSPVSNDQFIPAEKTGERDLLIDNEGTLHTLMSLGHLPGTPDTAKVIPGRIKLTISPVE